MPIRQNSGSSTPRTRPPATTLNIPGMTRSRVSPDGRIAERDVASKLVIIMVGLPARGKSYITKKIQRYLSWQQHNSQIFNVGNRRRVAASAQPGSSNLTAQIQARAKAMTNTDALPETSKVSGTMDGPTQAAHILLNGVEPSQIQESASRDHSEEPKAPMEPFDQSAEFFDPSNARASQVREQVAISTLDELLDYLLLQGGSAGILDATNSTLERRKMLFNRVKERDSKLGILFIESICEDQGVRTSSLIVKLMLTILL
jgi:6-phosphofructo-2-kinase